MKLLKQIFIPLLVLITLVISFNSCIKSETQDGETSITLSTEKLTFDKWKGVQEVEVSYEGSVGFYVKWEGGDWGKVSKIESSPKNAQPGKFVVTVNDNNTTSDREGTVVVSLLNGRFKTTIPVIQHSDTNPHIYIDTDSIVFSVEGGSKNATIDSHTGTWEFQHDAEDWLTIYSSFEDGKVILECEENDSTAARETRVLFSNTEASRSLIVIQEGRLYFVLPFLDLNPNYNISNKIKEYENSRGSFYLGYSEREEETEDPNVKRKIQLHEYLLKSKAFSQIKYQITEDTEESGGKRITEITVLPQSTEIFKDEEFKNFLIENKFTVENVESGSSLGTYKGEMDKITIIVEVKEDMVTYRRGSN